MQHGGGGGADAAGREAGGRADPEGAAGPEIPRQRHQGRAGGFTRPPRSPGRETNLPALPSGGGWAAGELPG